MNKILPVNLNGGAANNIVVLPDVSTLVVGQWITITNTSTANDLAVRISTGTFGQITGTVIMTISNRTATTAINNNVFTNTFVCISTASNVAGSWVTF